MNSQLICGGALPSLKGLGESTVDCCVTSPPYFGLRDYGVDGQIGLEQTPEDYVSKIVEIFREVRRVLKDDGTLWLNLGDSYAGSWGNYGGQNRGNGRQRVITSGSQVPNPAYDGLESFRPPTTNPPGLKPKDLIGIPWRVAFALQADGWYLRQDIIWHKPNPMPESVRDRCTKSHEYIFLLSKSQKYYFDHEAIKEKATGRKVSNKERKYTKEYESSDTELLRTKAGLAKLDGKSFETRNRRSVWTVATKPYKEAHFATYPPDLITPCILAGSRQNGFVLDPFSGSGTTCFVARNLLRRYIGIEINPEYHKLAEERLGNYDGLF